MPTVNPASSFAVGNAPGGASYKSPLVGQQIGDRLADLPEQYRQGAMQNAFPNGLPRDANGNIDVSAIADKLTKLGGAASAEALFPAIYKSSFLNGPDPLRQGNGSSPPSPVAPTTARNSIMGGSQPRRSSGYSGAGPDNNTPENEMPESNSVPQAHDRYQPSQQDTPGASQSGAGDLVVSSRPTWISQHGGRIWPLPDGSSIADSADRSGGG